MHLELHSTITPPVSKLTPEASAVCHPHAEIISRAWMAVAYIEELRVDLTRLVRGSPARDAAIGALQMATGHLAIAAEVLVPRELAQRAGVVQRGLARRGQGKAPASG